MQRIEKALMKDIKTLSEILNDAKIYQLENQNKQWNQPSGYPNEETLINDIKKEQLYTYIIDNKIIGFFVLMEEIEHDYDEIVGNWLVNANYTAIHRICIAKDYHHQGLGKKMLLEAINLAKEKGYNSVRIDTHKDNLPMQKTLEKLGFTKCGIITIKSNLTDPLRYAYEIEI